MSFTLYCTHSLYNNIATHRFPTVFHIRFCVKHLHTSRKKQPSCSKHCYNNKLLTWKSRILSKSVFAIGKDAAEVKIKTACKTTKQQNTLLHYRKWLEMLGFQLDTTPSQRWRLTVHLPLPFERTCACVELICKGDCRHATLSALQFG